MRARTLVSPDWTRFLIAGATKGDPNATENPANPFTQSGGIISGGLLGGLATNDPGSGVWWTRPAFDLLGNRLVGTDLYDAFFSFRETTPPALTDDTAVSVGLCNEADLNSATVEGVGIVFRYSAGTRAVGLVSIANGVATFSYDATPDGGSRRLIANIARWSTAGGIPAIYGHGFTDAGVSVAGDQISLGGPAGISGNLFWYLSFFRTSVDADTVALAVMGHHYGAPSPVSGYTPT